MRSDLVTSSFELAGMRCVDLTPLVYARLFDAHPELEAFFVMDRDGAVRGSMLAWAIRALMDFGTDEQFGGNLIRAEAINHGGLGVTADKFVLFFAAIADSVCQVLGPEWTPAMARAWAELLAELSGIVEDASTAGATAI